MDPISTLKDITQIVKKYNDLELMERIVDLQNDVFELEREKLDLRRELASLKDGIEKQRALELKTVGACNYYYHAGDPIPFCPKCYEGESKLVHLTNLEPWGNGFRRRCVVCSETFNEKPDRGGHDVLSYRGENSWMG